MSSRKILFFPRAVRDLEKLDERFVRQILADVELLKLDSWPPAKVKKLKGVELWEVKTGDYRTLFLPSEDSLVIARVVNRRDLGRAVERFDIRLIFVWLLERKSGE
jgi:mRNA-degrading endonuclease RelE of RelBE toxin-antitoxin system